MLDWIRTFRAARASRTRRKKLLSKVIWMVTWELRSVKVLEEALSEAHPTNSIYLNPGTWLAIGHPVVVELGEVIDFQRWWDRLGWAVADLNVIKDNIEKGNLRDAQSYLETRLALLPRRFDWKHHQEYEVGPKEAVEAKFEIERELRQMINEIKEFRDVDGDPLV